MRTTSNDTNYINKYNDAIDRHAQAASVSTARRARSLRCTPLRAGKIWIQLNWKLFEPYKGYHSQWTQFSFTTFSSAWRCRSSRIRLQSYRLGNSAKIKDVQMECARSQKPHFIKNGKIHCNTENNVPTVVP